MWAMMMPHGYVSWLLFQIEIRGEVHVGALFAVKPLFCSAWTESLEELGNRRPVQGGIYM